MGMKLCVSKMTSTMWRSRLSLRLFPCLISETTETTDGLRLILILAVYTERCREHLILVMYRLFYTRCYRPL